MLVKILLAGAVFLAVTTTAQESAALTNFPEQASYALGVEAARNLLRNGQEVNVNLVLRGMKDGFSGEKLLLGEKELDQVLQAIRTGVIHKQRSIRQTPAGMNTLRGRAFLNQNKTRQGVVSLPSGLQYLVLAPGGGPGPALTNQVEINYRATRLDGTEFLASKTGEPARFAVKDAFLPALAEALPLMSPGAKWKLFVPSQLAFGESGVGRDVGPNETIQVEVELLAVN